MCDVCCVEYDVLTMLIYSCIMVVFNSLLGICVYDCVYVCVSHVNK